MNDIASAGFDALARDLEAAGQALISAAGRARATAMALSNTQAAGENASGNPYRKANNRLNEAGAAAVDAAYSAGMTVTEVAQKFGIHTSAASYRRKLWEKTHGQKSA